MPKKKTSYIHPRHKNEVNKKAIIWIASAFVLIVVVISLLLVLDSIYK